MINTLKTMFEDTLKADKVDLGIFQTCRSYRLHPENLVMMAQKEAQAAALKEILRNPLSEEDKELLDQIYENIVEQRKNKKDPRP